MVFGRLKKKQQETAEDTAAETTTGDDGAAGADAAAARRVDRSAGPFDVSEKADSGNYIDLGALRIAAAEGLQLRLEVEEKTKRVIAVTLELKGSNLQLQAFAAPRSEGIWTDIRKQIGVSVGSQGGGVQEREGVFGPELLAKLPAQTPDGTSGFRIARFVGVDGPRWFLRGVFGGAAAMSAEAAAPMEELFRNIVVVRGEHPLPPRELLPLRLPKDAAAAQTGTDAGVRDTPEVNPLRRGPEITKIG